MPNWPRRKKELMRKVAIVFFVFFILGWSAFMAWHFWPRDFSFWPKIAELPSMPDDLAVYQKEKEVVAPPPLRQEGPAKSSFLTEQGVIDETNKHRALEGLPPLKLNSQLDQAAQNKAEDIFSKQYFEHIAPDGLGPAGLVENAGYEFIVVGENLALGNFIADQELVQDWMNSPGHRENILNVRFLEIGVAVKQGVFEGQKTWIAVQEFGLPLSVCFKPVSALRTEIESKESQLEARRLQLDTLKQQLDTASKKRGSDYQQQVEQYNQLVNQYNQQAAALRLTVDAYNQQAGDFNQCLTTH